MNALVPAKNASVDDAFRLMAPAITAMATGGDRALLGIKLPPWQQLEQIGREVGESLKKLTAPADAVSLVEILVGTRANAKMANPDVYLKAVKSRFLNCPPDVAAEAVHTLVTSNKYMPEVAELETAIQDATTKRNRIVRACRLGWEECRKRADENAAATQRKQERAARDECWQAWYQANLGAPIAERVTFEEFKQGWAEAE